jgi:hypothetical protein
MSLKEIHEDFRVKRGKESIGDDEPPWRPNDTTNDETAEAVHDLVMCDRRRDLPSIAREVGITFRFS